MEYVVDYHFTEDEIKALKSLEETLPSSAGQEVLTDIIDTAETNGYKGQDEKSI